MQDFNSKYYLSQTKILDSEAILLNNDIAGKDKGGLVFSEFTKNIAVENNSITGGNTINSGKFTIKSTNLKSVFLRMADFVKFIDGDVYLICVLSNGKIAYRKGKLQKANISELKRSDSLDTAFSLDFVSEYSGWKTTDYIGISYQKMVGTVEVTLTEAQTTALINAVKNNDMYFRIFQNAERNVFARFKLKKQSILSTNLASFIVDIDRFNGFYFSGSFMSQALKGNFTADYVSKDNEVITEFIFEISNLSRSIIINDFVFTNKIEAIIFDNEVIGV